VELAEKCWASDPGQRPTFREIVEELGKSEFLNSVTRSYPGFSATEYETYRDSITNPSKAEPIAPADGSPILRTINYVPKRDAAGPPFHTVALLGDSYAGKSALLDRAMTGRFSPESFRATVGQFVTLAEFQGSPKCFFELRDTAGAETFHSLAPMYVRNVHAALLVFDVTSRASFEGLRFWTEFLRDNADNPTVVIFANKTDISGGRSVTREEAEAFARDNAAILIEGSAKTGENVSSVFTMMAALLARSHGTETGQEARVVSPGDDEDGGDLERSGCCY
jgi:small GTP-binding protein